MKETVRYPAILADRINTLAGESVPAGDPVALFCLRAHESRFRLTIRRRFAEITNNADPVERHEALLIGQILDDPATLRAVVEASVWAGSDRRVTANHLRRLADEALAAHIELVIAIGP